MNNTAPFRSMDMARARNAALLRHPIEIVDSESDTRHLMLGGISLRKKASPVSLNEATAPPSAAEPWKVSNIPIVPADMPLEPTALLIEGISPSVIASRICEFMKFNSICCDYHGNAARVDCKTICGLKFVVQLWRKIKEQQCGTKQSTPNGCSDMETATILEVQRRRGCCIVMRSVRKSLYHAVLKNTMANSIMAGDGSRKKRSICLPNLPRSFPHSTDARIDTTPHCLDLLASARHDCNRFGLEMLLVLVDSDLVGTTKAEEVAQALAFGIGELGSKIRKTFLSIIALASPKSKEAADGCDVEDVSLLDCSLTIDEEKQLLRLLSAKVLSSCLDIIMEREQDYLCNEANMLDLYSDFWSKTASFLLLQMDECAKRQHEAALAAKCFRILESLHPGSMIPWTDSMVVTKAIKAYKLGQQQHLFLEQESGKLLHTLKVMKSVTSL
ncbi:hypothetical protein IV203_033091 [Nitzschia inconspicua]|uniref:Uncharacterized protein n=1 Tax=Nitzschia inconspicua TaxID=303405 RepID=A0A9K3KKX4_9STRA|nr:hypothetical protein IV203_033091 [Nitzschia inconspicua]